MSYYTRLISLFVLGVFSSVWADPSRISPDPRLTPGATLNVSVADISVPGYTKKVRDVSLSVKKQVYSEYGITHIPSNEYVVDHLIPLELGGSNSPNNLWPESRLTHPWNAHVKDALENRLYALVRSGRLDLMTAQKEIARDWIAAYKKYVRPKPGDIAPNKIVAAVTTDDGETWVWVNTKSGVIWKHGTAYYGKTKQGKYMSETEALAHGYHGPRENRIAPNWIDGCGTRVNPVMFFADWTSSKKKPGCPAFLGATTKISEGVILQLA